MGLNSMSESRIGIIIEYDTVKKAFTAVEKLDKSVDKLSSATAKSSKQTIVNPRATKEIKLTKTSVDSLNRSLSRLSKYALAAISSFAGFQTLKYFTDVASQIDKINASLTTALGSSEAAANAFSQVVQISKELGLNLQVAADNYSQLAAAAKGTTLAGSNVMKIFKATAKATVALGLSTEATKNIQM